MSDKLNTPRSIWSLILPGVPTTMCAPLSNVLRSARGSIPPTQEANCALVRTYSHSSSFLTCKANSLVGAIIIARGIFGRSNSIFSASNVLAIEIPKASVFPEPV